MNPLERVERIERIEVELTVLNARRSLVPVARRLEIDRVGGATLLREETSPGSIYYNRVKGFGPQELQQLDRILEHYPKGAPCFDMTPDRLTEEVSRALIGNGYAPVEHLVFMAAEPARPPEEAPAAPFHVERVTEETAAEFIRWIGRSMGGQEFGGEVAERSRPYFYREDFVNYMLRIDGQPAAMGSLFISGDAGYLANDYTFEAYRGRGAQAALIRERLQEASRLGLAAVYTDVEFGSASHRNMERAGFRTAFLNTFWVQI